MKQTPVIIFLLRVPMLAWAGSLLLLAGCPQKVNLKPSRCASAEEYARKMKWHVEDFRLELAFHPAAGRPVERLVFYTTLKTWKPRPHAVPISDTEARRIIDFLKDSHWLETAEDRTANYGPMKPPPTPSVSLRINYGIEKLVLHENLGWNPRMFSFLTDLNAVLEGDAAAEMSQFLDQIRQEWPSSKPSTQSTRPQPTTHP